MSNTDEKGERKVDEERGREKRRRERKRGREKELMKKAVI